MTEAVIAQTTASGRAAGEAIAATIRDGLKGGEADALIVFASPDQDYGELLEALVAGSGAAIVIGCSSAGEFTSEQAGMGMTCAVALRAPEMAFTATIGRGLRTDRSAAADSIVAGFRGRDAHQYRYRSALLLTDALAGFADDLVDRLTLLTGGLYKFFGGGAGDDARFERTYVFHGTEVAADAAVALEILSNSPLGIGVSHGWTPKSDPLRVTEARGIALASLNATPAIDVFDSHADFTGQRFDHDEPMPFFLHNVLGVESTDGYRLRVPLTVEQDGSITCAADVPEGTKACIMSTSPESAADAAAGAARAAREQLGDAIPAVAFLFDCVATRLRLGHEFGRELDAVRRELGEVPFCGFNTYGQIAQAEGQFSGFHNCTAVVCIIPK